MKKAIFIIIVITGILFFQCKQDTGKLKWPEITKEAKPGTYWWWMGSAVDKKGLDYNLQNLADAGIGTVHVIPIYGVRGEEKKHLNFLSPRWMGMLSYATVTSGSMGLNTDMSTTTGWPFGGSHVTKECAAKKIEYEVVPVEGNETLRLVVDTENVETTMAFSGDGGSADLRNMVDKNGFLKWTAPPGEWQVYVLTEKGTGQKVKRAAPGNEGLVLDPFSVEALKFYLARFDTAFSSFPYIGIRAQYHDSYEYYRATWTNGLLEKFRKRYGYDLRNHLPELFDTTKINPYIKADYRRLIAELHLEYIKAWGGWSHRQGWITRNQAHGAPGNLLDLYAAADIPETETFGARKFDIPGFRFNKENNSTSAPPNPLILKFASSAAHVTGKNLVSSETGTWLRDHYKVALSQVKPEIDELFISGINHIFYHGNAYSPEDAPWPGWIFYASTHFEKENSIWNDIPQLNGYVARCQSVLQSGKSSNDVLLYWPVEEVYHSFSRDLIKNMTVHDIDWFERFDIGKLAEHLDEEGYSFDYISDSHLKEVSVINGKLYSYGNRYKTVVVPETKYIPLKTWKQLKRIASEGGSVIFRERLPEDITGFAGHEKRLKEFRDEKAKLKFTDMSGVKLKRAFVGHGIFYLGDVDAGLKECEVKPEKLPSFGLKFIRREIEDGYYYFITNLTGKKVDNWIPLSVNAISAFLFDPRFEARIGKAALRQNGNDKEIYLQLAPGESCILRTFTDEDMEGAKWQYLHETADVFEITGEWNLEFMKGGPKLPGSVSTRNLKSWTEYGDSAAVSFAGTGRYTIEFELLGTEYDDYVLNLGKVCESAKVFINRKEAGHLWSFPYELRIGRYLKKGKNTLEVEVTNLSANRIRNLDRRGVDWKKFFFVNIFYNKFDAANWPVMESGLIGPVTLQGAKYLQPTLTTPMGEN